MTGLLSRDPGEPPSFSHPDTGIDPNIGRANRVLRRCRVNAETGCWEWQDATNGAGYGRVKIDGFLYLSHRIVAAAAGLIAGPSEDDDWHLILHSCDNRRCCNPAHMRAGTHLQNAKDCVARGRRRNPNPRTRKGPTP